MISVLICTYNQEKYIAQAIESVLMQKCVEAFEILVGDDCSTDTTGTIVDEYQKQYPEIVRVIRPLENGGTSRNFLNLFKSARGEFISICDGDDYWLRNDVLQQQYAMFRDNPNVGLVCAKAKCFIQTRGVYEGVLGDIGAEDLRTMLKTNRDVAAPTVAYRKQLMCRCIEECTWYFEHDYFYDTIIAYWFAYNSNIKFIDKELAAYRVLPNSACHDTDAEKVALYSKRYFMVKWYFVMTHPDLCNLKMFDILRQDYDQRTEEIRYLTERKIRNTMSYTMGSIILSPVKKLFNIFKK